MVKKRIFLFGAFFVMLAMITLMSHTKDSKACCVLPTIPTIDVLECDPEELWPPNHKMVEITLTVEGTYIAFWEISNVEILNLGKGEGDPENDPDYEIIGQQLKLCAERSGKMGIRVYVITVTAYSGDDYGSSTSADVRVMVPHDQGAAGP